MSHTHFLTKENFTSFCKKLSELQWTMESSCEEKTECSSPAYSFLPTARNVPKNDCHPKESYQNFLIDINEDNFLIEKYLTQECDTYKLFGGPPINPLFPDEGRGSSIEDSPKTFSYFSKNCSYLDKSIWTQDSGNDSWPDAFMPLDIKEETWKGLNTETTKEPMSWAVIQRPVKEDKFKPINQLVDAGAAVFPDGSQFEIDLSYEAFDAVEIEGKLYIGKDEFRRTDDGLLYKVCNQDKGTQTDEWGDDAMMMTRTARRHYHFPIFQNWHTSQTGENQDLLSDFLNPQRIREMRGDINEKDQMVDMLRSIVNMQHIWDKPATCNGINEYQDHNAFIPTMFNGLAATYTILQPDSGSESSDDKDLICNKIFRNSRM
ncbi:uncharacterized protein LOC126847477 [Adelges cooleyi]|uniref:uncharacterized protein LOC126847477 n=1 Tax=Adelges cooleyi TaxID=133065 RepID=UPI00217FA8F2|nr:uncharacterized protein LOC126847477 [Adelges cooleyi]